MLQTLFTRLMKVMPTPHMSLNICPASFLGYWRSALTHYLLTTFALLASISDHLLKTINMVLLGVTTDAFQIGI